MTASVGAIDYRELGGTLRHPSWKGITAAVYPAEVVLPAEE